MAGGDTLTIACKWSIVHLMNRIYQAAGLDEFTSAELKLGPCISRTLKAAHDRGLLTIVKKDPMGNTWRINESMMDVWRVH